MKTRYFGPAPRESTTFWSCADVNRGKWESTQQQTTVSLFNLQISRCPLWATLVSGTRAQYQLVEQPRSQGLAGLEVRRALTNTRFTLAAIRRKHVSFFRLISNILAFTISKHRPTLPHRLELWGQSRTPEEPALDTSWASPPEARQFWSHGILEARIVKDEWSAFRNRIRAYVTAKDDSKTLRVDADFFNLDESLCFRKLPADEMSSIRFECRFVFHKRFYRFCPLLVSSEANPLNVTTCSRPEYICQYTCSSINYSQTHYLFVPPLLIEHWDPNFSFPSGL